MQSGPSGQIRVSGIEQPFAFGPDKDMEIGQIRPGFVLTASVMRNLVQARAQADRPLTLQETDRCAQEAFARN